MKKFTLIFILSFILSFMLTTYSAFAVKVVIGKPGGSGGVIVNGTWQTGDTVIVYDHMIIPAGDSLTIQGGVTVYMADTILKIELICLGNFYCVGTQEHPVTITTLPSLVPPVETHPFPSLWGGILCDTTCHEFLMLYTDISDYGGPSLNNSPSVLLNIWRTPGSVEPCFNYNCPSNGKIVVENCTIHTGPGDNCCVTGGNFICCHNLLYQDGKVGSEGFEVHSGVHADMCYNLFYSMGGTGISLSNSGGYSPQGNIFVYNNTFVNNGMRKTTPSAGALNLSSAIIAHCYNDLEVNDRFGIKESATKPPDSSCKADYNYYYGYTKTIVYDFTSAANLFPLGAHDIRGDSAKDKNPMFVDYPLSTDTMNAFYCNAWDFHLLSNSPALGAGRTNFTPFFSTNGVTILGVTYTSPAPSNFMGAFGETTLGINSLAASQKGSLNIFPNPVKSDLTLQFIATSDQSVIMVYSLLGQLIISKSIENNIGLNTLSIPVDNLANGIYAITLKNSNSVITKKFVKE